MTSASDPDQSVRLNLPASTRFVSSARVVAASMGAEVGLDVVEWRYTRAFEMTGRPPARLRLRVLNSARRLVDKVSPELSAHQLGGYSLLVLAR